MPAAERPPVPAFGVAAVLLGCFIAGFHTRLFGVGLPDLRGAMGLEPDQGAWLSTIALAPQILVAPAITWLVTVFGLRRVLVGPALLYALLSLLIPVVRDYPTLLVLHALHGALLGVFVPAALMVIFRGMPQRLWTAGIAIYVFRAGFTLNAGIGLAGFHAALLGWQWIYWQDVLLAPVMAWLAWRGAPRVAVDRTLLARADWGGMLLFGGGLTMLYVALDQGNRLDWMASGTIIGLLAGGAALLAGFALNEVLVANPWASLRVIASRNIGLMLVTGFCFSLLSMSNGLLVPNFLMVVQHLRPEQAGWPLFLGSALPMIALVPLAVLAVRHFDARLVLMSGLMGFAIAAWLASGLTRDWAGPDFLLVAFLQAFGQSFTFLALILYGLGNSNPTQATAFVAYIQVVRLLGVEFGQSLLGTFLRMREQVQSYQLGLNLAAGGRLAADALARLGVHFYADGALTAPARALATLAATVQREAFTLAHIDAFRLSFWVAVGTVALVAFMGASPPGPFTPWLAKKTGHIS
ncbi:MFS transporter [Muricoccus nepalensis]|nr:MFS transporter [Roseomonas nepalensis]